VQRVSPAGRKTSKSVRNAADNEVQSLEKDYEEAEILLFMVALCNRADYYIFIRFLSFSSSSSSSFSSPNLSGRKLDVYHTSTYGVALVRI